MDGSHDGPTSLEATSNLRCHCPHEQSSGRFLAVDMAPRIDRCAARDSDSEGENERSCLERWQLRRLAAQRCAHGRRGELKRRDDDGVLCLRSEHSAKHVLSDERRRARRNVRAAVIRRDARSASRARVPARSSRSGLRVAPGGAQQRGAGRHRECQHDRKDSRSEHVDAQPGRGKTGAIRAVSSSGKILSVFGSVWSSGLPKLRIFPRTRQKSRGTHLR